MEPNDAGPVPWAGGISDRELWARAVDGDREAFGRIFDRHAKTVYNYLFRRTADWSEAEDLTSTVFMHAWRRRSDTVLDRDSALPWLLGIADRLLSNTRRRLRRAEALLHRLVSHDEPVGDHADRVADLVDDERRISTGRWRGCRATSARWSSSASGRAWTSRPPRRRWGSRSER
jgi:DNA-directed RNA polymerase specialized sigma24 family protein